MAGTAAVTLACIRPGAYPCARDSQCDGQPAGVCVQPEGFCSYADDDCDSGLRFESRAPGGLGGTCVEATDAVGSSSDGVGTDEADGSSSDGSETSAESTGAQACGEGNEPCCAQTECNGSNICVGETCTCLQLQLVGDFHTCVIRWDQRFECWGGNLAHALGRDDPGQSFPTPGPVTDLPQPLLIVSGQARTHTCVVALGGAAYCWGDNMFGQSNPGSAEVATPRAVDVAAMLELPWESQLVGVGAAHTCLAGDGRMFCWGNNEAGQLGWTIPDEPGEVDSTTFAGPVAQIAAGLAHTCVRTGSDDVPNADEHAVYCWGYDEVGHLGTGPGDDSSVTPVAAAFDPGLVFAEIAASDSHTCAIAFEPDTPDEREIYCWGDDTEGGVTGLAGGGSEPTPIRVPGLFAGPWSDLSVSGGRTCAVNDEEGAWCWGRNDFGISDPSSSDLVTAPASVSIAAPLDTFVYSVGAGLAHTCGLAADGSVACWGCGLVGQLGEEGPLCVDGEPEWGAVRSTCQ